MMGQFRLLIVFVVCCLSGAIQAQNQQQNQPTDVQAVAVSTEIMLSVLEEWKEWHEEPTAANAYVGDFMKSYNVPQTPEGPLDLPKTWHWWMSHHPDELKKYFEMKEVANQ